jgi:hypothetical protein
MPKLLVDYDTIVGRRYGQWVVKEIVKKGNRRKLRCECGCGRVRHIAGSELVNGQTTQCQKCAYLNSRKIKIGDKFGKYTTVLDHTIDGELYFDCVCECGHEQLIRSGALNQGTQLQCVKCSGLERRKGAAKAVWSRVLAGAKKRGLLVEVTLDEAISLIEKQNYKCALSGLPIKFAETSREHNNKQQTTASLDRIDSDGDYTHDNIQWVHKHLNVMKWAFSEEEFIRLCLAVVETKLPEKLATYTTPSTDYPLSHLMAPNPDFTLVG